MNEEQKTIIYTDGSSLGNPGAGGWGAIVLVDGQVTELGGAESNTTNNRMEMLAIIEALEWARACRARAITLYSDSSYVINGITKWVHGWQKNGWQKKDGSDVLNKDLWERLVNASGECEILWKHLSGHIGTPGNERADTIASGFAAGQEPHLYTGSRVDYQIDLDAKEDTALKTARGRDRARARTKAYSYLSLVDGEFKKHKTWAECEKCVKGKNGAKFRKAVSAEDEKDIMKEWGV